MTPNDVARFILGGLVVIGFSVVAVGWFYAPDRGGANRDVIMLIVGALSTGYGTVLGYFFSRKE